MEIWNNPSCSKCAAAREKLDLAGIPYRVRSYLTEPPTPEEFAAVLDRMGAEPWDVCRTGEPIAAELGLTEWPREDRDRWIAAMVAHPVLIQRPILLWDDGRAAVARTPEALDEI